MGHARGALVVAVLLLAAGCGRAPAAAGSGEADSRQARQALDRYEQAWAAAAPGFVPAGPVYSQIRDWEPAIGENNKLALGSGQLRPAGDLPEDTHLLARCGGRTVPRPGSRSHPPSERWRCCAGRGRVTVAGACRCR